MHKPLFFVITKKSDQTRKKAILERLAFAFKIGILQLIFYYRILGICGIFFRLADRAGKMSQKLYNPHKFHARKSRYEN